MLGEYHMDKKHGYGIYIWADGRRYEGLWQNGKQHGKGKYILPNNTVKVGIWEDGKRIRWIDQYQVNEEGTKDVTNQVDDYGKVPSPN